MFSEFKSNEAFFYGLCDATSSEVWCLGSLGVIPRYLSFILFYFTVHGSLFTAQEQPPKPWLFSFISSPNPTNPCPLWKPYYLSYFLAYFPPKPNPKPSKQGYYQICPNSSKSDYVCYPCPTSHGCGNYNSMKFNLW